MGVMFCLSLVSKYLLGSQSQSRDHHHCELVSPVLSATRSHYLIIIITVFHLCVDRSIQLQVPGWLRESVS